MPRFTSRRGRFLFKLLLASLAGLALARLGRNDERAEAERHDHPGVEPDPYWEPEEYDPPEWEMPRSHTSRFTPRRVAVAGTLTALFFAGASFTAFAGDQTSRLFDDSTDPAAVETTTTTDSATTDASSTEAAAPAPDDAAPAPPASDDSAARPAPDASATDPAAAAQPSTPAAPAAAAPAAQPDGSDAARTPSESVSEPSGSRPSARPQGNADASANATRTAPLNTSARKQLQLAQAAKAKPPALDPEAEQPGVAATVWLNRALPDPTPPARRLERAFAHRLVADANAANVDWALVLGTLRAEGARASVPATAADLLAVSRRLGALKQQGKGDWDAVLALTGRTSVADRAVALANYDRAVGVEALVNGLEAQKQALTRALLADNRVDIYPGGRDDLQAGRVDIRVIVLIRYLAQTYGQVTVSCLISGHRLYARPGVISAHMYGRAADIAELGGIPIMGHQEPGGITERGVRSILLLPAELQPLQVISLLGLGGPSFPLANHYDHIHVGY
jgi:hypothetical protein